jgi:hypothetical protein
MDTYFLGEPLASMDLLDRLAWINGAPGPVQFAGDERVAMEDRVRRRLDWTYCHPSNDQIGFHAKCFLAYMSFWEPVYGELSEEEIVRDSGLPARWLRKNAAAHLARLKQFERSWTRPAKQQQSELPL